MKRIVLKTISFFLAFIAGFGTTSLVRLWRAPAQLHQITNASAENNRLTVPDIALPATPEIYKPRPVSISPYEIKRLVDENNRTDLQNVLDLEPIWEQLSIKKSDHDLNQCTVSCDAEIAELELDGMLGRETLLRLSGPVTDRYLIFKRMGAQKDRYQSWQLLGYIDAFTRWSDFTYRIEAAGRQRWLVITETSGHGSGFGSYTDCWYEVSENGVTEVLFYQSSLFAASWDTYPSVERETKVLKTYVSNGVTTVVLESSTSYRSLKEDCLLWTNKRRATFIKGLGMQRFTFDALHSQMLEKELSPNFGDGAYITNEELLKYNYRELMMIANERWTKRKAWLFEFLKGCDDSTEKQSLYETAVINDKCQS